MEELIFGRKKFEFFEGKVTLYETTITVKAFPNEDEKIFTRRIMEKYGRHNGTFEIVFKKARPDYAIVHLE